MKTIVLSIVGLAVLGFVATASAEPVKLSSQQMATITAGTNPHPTVNPGGQPHGCPQSGCTKTTGKWN
jgi:hypothetical protein